MLIFTGFVPVVALMSADAVLADDGSDSDDRHDDNDFLDFE